MFCYFGYKSGAVRLPLDRPVSIGACLPSCASSRRATTVRVKRQQVWITVG